MSRKKPALKVLGISPEFAKSHDKEVVLAVADATYLAVAKKCHPDRGSKKVSLPKSVTLSDLEEARDEVRANLAACIKETTAAARKTREAKIIDELNVRIEEDGKQMKALLGKIGELWTFIIRSSLGAKNPDVVLDDGGRIGYSVHNLDGVAVLVSKDGSKTFSEYISHQGLWFERKVQKVNFGNKAQCPPGIPQDLITMTGSVTETGNFYDQISPHEMLSDFVILGSYEKKALSNYRRKKHKDPMEEANITDKMSLFAKTLLGESADLIRELDSDIQAVLQPYVAVGHIVVAAALTSKQVVHFKELGNAAGVRVFDQKQRQ